jgi:hypothetical protein
MAGSRIHGTEPSTMRAFLRGVAKGGLAAREGRVPYQEIILSGEPVAALAGRFFFMLCL